jgi:hypothetical protein
VATRGRRVCVDGHAFKNELEYRKYKGVIGLVQKQRLSDLRVHPKYPLRVNGELVGHFDATFEFYDEKERRTRVILVGAAHSPAVRMKLKLFETLNEVTVELWA